MTTLFDGWYVLVFADDEFDATCAGDPGYFKAKTGEVIDIMAYGYTDKAKAERMAKILKADNIVKVRRRG